MRHYEGLYGDKAAALAALRRGLARAPITEIPAGDRPWWAVRNMGLILGDARLVREAAVGIERDLFASSSDSIGTRAAISGSITFAEKRWEGAIRDFTVAEQHFAAQPRFVDVVRGFSDRELGRADSAIAAFERFITMPDPFPDADARWRVTVLQNLGELYEATGNAKKAIERYGQITQMWAKADPALQPRVKDIRERIARLMKDSG